MLEKTDILTMIKLIKLNFGYAFNGASENDLEAIIGLWYNNLKIYPKEVVSVAFNRIMTICTKQPSLADIIEQIKEIASAGQPSENEYWTELEKAVDKIRQIFYFGGRSYMSQDGLVKPLEKAQELFEKLSPVVREYLGSWHTLKSLSELDTLEFERNRFFKVMPNLKTRCEIKQTISQNVIHNADFVKLESAKLQIDDKKD